MLQNPSSLHQIVFASITNGKLDQIPAEGKINENSIAGYAMQTRYPIMVGEWFALVQGAGRVQISRKIVGQVEVHYQQPTATAHRCLWRAMLQIEVDGNHIKSFFGSESHKSQIES